MKVPLVPVFLVIITLGHDPLDHGPLGQTGGAIFGTILNPTTIDEGPIFGGVNK